MGAQAPVRYHYFHRCFTYAVGNRGSLGPVLASRLSFFSAEVRRGHCQVGSLAGAAHLLNDNTGDPRSAQSGRKPLVEFKGKS